MSETVALRHACWAPAGEVPIREAAQLINAGFIPEESPGIPTPFIEDNSKKPCTTCPLPVRMAACLGQAGLLEVLGDIPEGCYFRSQIEVETNY